MSAATPPSSARTTSCPATSRSTSSRMKLWEGLEQDLNYNAMVSQRGVLNLFHSDGQRDAYARRGNAMRLHGVDAELLDRERRARACCPFLDFDNARFPIQGGLLQRRGGTVRHDAVAWGYARGADRARRRHHPELRGHGHPHRERPRRRASRPRAASSARARSALAVAGQLVARRRDGRACGCRSRATCCRPSSPRALKPLHRPASSPSAPGTSTSASPTRAGSSSAATSTATTPTPSAATCRSSRT